MHLARGRCSERQGISPGFSQTRYGPQRRAGKRLQMQRRHGFDLPRGSGKLDRWFGLGGVSGENWPSATKRPASNWSTRVSVLGTDRNQAFGSAGGSGTSAGAAAPPAGGAYPPGAQQAGAQQLGAAQVLQQLLLQQLPPRRPPRRPLLQQCVGAQQVGAGAAQLLQAPHGAAQLPHGAAQLVTQHGVGQQRPRRRASAESEIMATRAATTTRPRTLRIMLPLLVKEVARPGKVRPLSSCPSLAINRSVCSSRLRREPEVSSQP